MRAELIAAADLTPRELVRWRELAARALEPNPFFEPEYVLPLARGLGQEKQVQLLVAHDGEDWHGCLPVHLEPRWRGLPMRSVATWRGHVLYGLLGTPLIRSEDPVAATEALLDQMPGPRSGAGLAVLEWVSCDGPLGDTVSGLLDRRRPAPIKFERFERAALRRRAEPTYLEETLSSKHRRELGRQRRRLGEALGGEPTMVERTGEDAVYEELIRLEAAATKAEQGTVLAATPGHATFFVEMCRAFDALGRLQMLALQVDGQTVAMKCNLLAGDTIFPFKIAYDERWSACSPGILLELEMLKFFHERTEAQMMDSCADANNAMINRLWPDRRELGTFLLPAHGLRGRARRPALLAARSIRNHRIA
ncbi:MAG: GNAT family N-acetyltransferase [Solirubrobacterales bacterium]